MARAIRKSETVTVGRILIALGERSVASLPVIVMLVGAAALYGNMFYQNGSDYERVYRGNEGAIAYAQNESVYSTDFEPPTGSVWVKLLRVAGLHGLLELGDGLDTALRGVAHIAEQLPRIATASALLMYAKPLSACLVTSLTAMGAFAAG